MRMRVYEYPIKSKELSYKGSYTIKVGCENEQKLKKQLKAKLVQEFELK